MSLPCPGTSADCWDRVLHSLSIVQVHLNTPRPAQGVQSLIVPMSQVPCREWAANYLHPQLHSTLLHPDRLSKLQGQKRKSDWRRPGAVNRGKSTQPCRLSCRALTLTQDITFGGRACTWRRHWRQLGTQGLRGLQGRDICVQTGNRRKISIAPSPVNHTITASLPLA